jgi:hypothetical protein
MKLISNVVKNDNIKVYDFTVDDAHHYVLDNTMITHNSYVPMKEMGGGSGLKYTASQIVFLSKKKDRDGKDVVGNIIRCRMIKSRFTKENKDVEVKLHYERGLDRYYGLVELAEKYGIFKKVSTRIELPDGKKVFGKTINDNPEEYFTEEILKQLDEAAAKEFMYGKDEDEDVNAMMDVIKAEEEQELEDAKV